MHQLSHLVATFAHLRDHIVAIAPSSGRCSISQVSMAGSRLRAPSNRSIALHTVLDPSSRRRAALAGSSAKRTDQPGLAAEREVSLGGVNRSLQWGRPRPHQCGMEAAGRRPIMPVFDRGALKGAAANVRNLWSRGRLT
jgi:hypothetical protein